MVSQRQQSDQSWKLLVLTLHEISIIQGINLSEISKVSGIRQSTLRRFFSCQFKPTLPTLFLVACALNINFFTDTRDNNIFLREGYDKALEKINSNLIDAE